MADDPRDDLPAHLEFIQDIIDRQSRCSFLLKGWSVTLVSAIAVLAVRSADPKETLAVAILPALAFWGLDAFYLHQERRFRALYDRVRKASPSEERFSLSLDGIDKRVPGWQALASSPSTFWFHLPVILAVIVLMLIVQPGTANGP